jgi:hypothetical protein
VGEFREVLRHQDNPEPSPKYSGKVQRLCTHYLKLDEGQFYLEARAERANSLVMVKR